MSRLIRYIIILAVSVLWLGGLSTAVAHWFYETGVIVNDYRYGDLYRLANLPQFKDPQRICPSDNLASDTARTHLYILGDSFSEPQRLSKQDFPVSHFQRVQWDHPRYAQLDPTKRNVLLIETVERHFRNHFSTLTHELVVVKDTSSIPTRKLTWYQWLAEDFHLNGVEERLESALFSHDVFFHIREFKSWLTYRWFDRWNPMADLSTDRQHIFINMDTDTTMRLNSSFSPLPERELNTLIDSVNSVANRYKKAGFDEVYLSIIPNKATIVDPNRGQYNHLIERVQQHPALQVGVVDIYSVYKKSRQPLYLVGDSHWNCDGRALWLNQVRRTLRL